MTATTTAPPGFGVDTPVSRITGVGPKQLERLERLGITTVRDLLFHLPRRYDDTRELVGLAQLRPGDTQTARVRVRSSMKRRTPKKGINIVEASLEDEGDIVTAVWFNLKFIPRPLQTGSEIIVSGPVKWSNGGLEFVNPKYEYARDEQHHVGTVAPVYSVTEGLTSKQLRDWVEPLLTLASAVPDAIPDQVRGEERLMPLASALRQVHFPATPQEGDVARERIAFEELFLLQLAAERARRRRQSGRGVVVPYDVEVARAFVASLPFKLTDGQRVAAHEILTDMAATGPMNRLLQGDVGSGKTVVAAMAALMAHRAGLQAAVMAPTEILARQHAATLDRLLTPHGLPPRLLVGSTGARARREVIDALASGHDALIVGTHALIEDDVAMENLGLAVVDEQHRFGVAQRQKLRQKSGAM
ncbi:MAG: DEAD/DEAH box helicase, partial [Candidatus Dormibacteraeota bacterium]|nr:DEAD/DEAH box helicase [Candidatus Dormibacteraeota bacterium]